jgi:hypothetical protein
VKLGFVSFKADVVSFFVWNGEVCMWKSTMTIVGQVVILSCF